MGQSVIHPLLKLIIISGVLAKFSYVGIYLIKLSVDKSYPLSLYKLICLYMLIYLYMLYKIIYNYIYISLYMVQILYLPSINFIPTPPIFNTVKSLI